tara:strand:+ start:193 stop:534 length:342 start_codon:yes stop_codon:yes gene_type:complete
MDDQSILDNAPEGATHVDNGGAYFKLTAKGHIFWWVNKAEWMPAESNRSTRSLVDIARIAKLEKALILTNNELSRTIDGVNNDLDFNSCSSDLDDPDYWDHETCHNNSLLLKK